MFIPNNLLHNTLFVDIETVSQHHHYHELSETMVALWRRKAKQLDRELDLTDEDRIAALYQEKAGIFAEFSKVVCISCGYMRNEQMLRIKSIASDDEYRVLDDFAYLLRHHYDDPTKYNICGHNIKEFDIPFLCRRMVKHKIPLPAMFQIAGKKPWQTEHLVDTMDLWRFGDHKNYTSLNLLAGCLDIPSPKDDIDGSQVGRVYWEDQQLDRIVKYCQKDVVTVVQVMRHYAGLDQLKEEEIEILEDSTDTPNI